MTSYSSLDTAIQGAVRNGAVDYVIKPFHNDALLFSAIERALNERRMQRENAVLKRTVKGSQAQPDNRTQRRHQARV